MSLPNQDVEMKNTDIQGRSPGVNQSHRNKGNYLQQKGVINCIKFWLALVK